MASFLHIMFDKLRLKTPNHQVDNSGIHFGCFGSMEQRREATQSAWEIQVASFHLLVVLLVQKLLFKV